MEVRWWTSALATALAGVVYLATLYPSVAGGDAGELVLAAADGGIAHPPGYPLFTWLGWLFSAIPAGDLALRINGMCALFAALAAGLLHRAVLEHTRHHAAAALAAGLFAFAGLTWPYAVSAEVFSLNNLLAAALCLLCVRFPHAPRPVFLTAALLLGIGLSHHQTILLVGAPMLVWMVLCRRELLLNVRTMASAAGLLLLGLLPYLTLPWAARGVDMPWDHVDTVDGLVGHLLRRTYGTLQLASDGAQSLGNVTASLAGLMRSLAGMVLGLGLIPAAAAVMRWRTNPFLPALLVHALVFQALSNLDVRDPLLFSVVARFWQLPGMMLCVLAGVGLPHLLKSRAAVVTTGALLLQVGLNVPERQSTPWVAAYGRALLQPLPPGAILLTRKDLVTNAVRYLQRAESLRPDVTVLDQELMTRPWYVSSRAEKGVVFPTGHFHPREADGFTMAAFLDANRARPVFVFPDMKEGDESWVQQYDLWPVGLAFQVILRSAPPDAAVWNEQSQRALDAMVLPTSAAWRAFPEGTWERIVMADFLDAHARRAAHLLQHAGAGGDARADLTQVATELTQLTQRHPKPTWPMFKNLGIAQQRLMAWEPERREGMRNALRRYLDLAPAHEPDRAAVAELLR